MTNENILKVYSQGFNDELNSVFDNLKVNPNLDGRAYNLGSLHAIVGDDVSSIRNLSDNQILEIIKSKVIKNS